MVVFGSGASINDITDVEWQWISRQDTMGVNFWPLHPFVPKMLMFELDARESRRAEMMEVFARRAAEYRDTFMLTHTLDPHSVATLRRLRRPFPDLAVTHFHKISNRAATPELLERRMQLFARLYRAGLLRRPSVVGGSMFRALSLGHLMGYDRLVLAGFDMNGSPNFWEGREAVSTGQSGSTHRTMLLNETFRINALDAVQAASRCLFEYDAPRIWVMNPSSALHTSFPHLDLAGAD